MSKKITGVLIIEILPILLSIIFAITIFVFNKFLPPKVPLFYSLNWGEFQLATNLQLFILPAITSSISLINLMIYWHLKQSTLLKNILLTTSIIATIVLLISYAKIVLLFI